MKKGVLGLILAVLLFARCDNGDLGPGFEMAYIQDFEIFAGLNTIDTHIYEFEIESNYQNYLTQQGITADDIETIVPKFIRFSNLSGNQEYNILNRVRINVSNLDGTLEYEVAYREPVPLNTTFDMDLIPTLAKVPEQLSGNKFKVKVKLNFNQTSPISIDTRMFLTFQTVLKE
jgi:hypothetical protein